MDLSTYLDQGEVWIPKEGEPVEIADMSPEWRRNAAKWLLRRAEILRVECRIATLRRELHETDEYDAEFRREGTEDLVNLLRGISKPDEWIKGTDLYRALDEQAADEQAADEPDQVADFMAGLRIGFRGLVVPRPPRQIV